MSEGEQGAGYIPTNEGGIGSGSSAVEGGKSAGGGMNQPTNDINNNSNFAENNNNGKASKTGLDNRPAMESSAISETLGGHKDNGGISRTIEASNRSGSNRAIYTTEELEELEARGINPLKITNIKQL